MSAAEVSYYSFLIMCSIWAVVPFFVGIHAAMTIYRGWGQDILSVQVDRGLAYAALVSACMLVPLGTVGLVHVSQLTPNEFVKEFVAASHQRTS